MKFNTSELTGARLDQAVAKACGYFYDNEIRHGVVVVSIDKSMPEKPDQMIHQEVCRIIKDEHGVPYTPETMWATGSAAKGLTYLFCPSQNWKDGGPIIEREHISIEGRDRNGRPTLDWVAKLELPLQFGPTPLIAAMRAFVASKFGPEVDL